jgi:transcriptional regulator with XRE-family HTH domain
MASFRAKYTETERKAFGRMLRKMMEDRGLTGAELARLATRQLSGGKVIGRDNISWYLNGRSMPTPVYLNAIAKVLEVSPLFLVPRNHDQKAGEMPPPDPKQDRNIRMSLTTEGMHLMMDVHLPREVGWKILQIVEGTKPEAPAKQK